MIEPKSNSYLIGQEEAEAFLLKAYKNSALHNSYIFAGEKGIGKATLAYKFARFLLSNPDGSAATLDISPDCPTFKQVENNSHPDFKIIERSYNKSDTTKIIKAIQKGAPLSQDELQDFKKSSVIKIDEIRTINEFLSKSSGMGGYRVVIIDSIDDLNQSSSNAVLKVLEEPPHKTILILISHNPNSLLPTIKSRCAKLFLKPLSKNVVASLLRRYVPDLEESKVKALSELSSSSIGKAIDYANFDVAEQYDLLQKVVYAKNKFLLKDLLELADTFSKSDETFAFGTELILKFLSDNIKSLENIDSLTNVYSEAIKSFADTTILNLDKKQAIIRIINKIIEVI